MMPTPICMHGLALALVLLTWRPTKAQSIWLAPADDLERHGHVLVKDYTHAFETAAPWTEALSHLQVFVLGEHYSDIGSEETLKRIFAFLGQHNIRLALGLGMLPGEGGCGRGVEGMISRGNAGRIAERVKRLGGDVAFVVMDEPLFYGHRYDKRNACRMSIGDVARGVADSVAQLKKLFPKVRVGDVEPLQAFSEGSGITDLPRWFDEYRLATGEPLAFFQVELGWKTAWQQPLGHLQRMLEGVGIPLGVMFTASEPQNSDEDWIASAKANIIQVERYLRSPLGQAVFTSWTRHPSHLLPESSPGTLPYLIDWYARGVR